ncbi:MAG TPA: hypothetical protein VKN99_17885 [Polyangia bacterium]|nr:hypothetical protein [Polyangia bacterium]
MANARTRTLVAVVVVLVVLTTLLEMMRRSTLRRAARSPARAASVSAPPGSTPPGLAPAPPARAAPLASLVRGRWGGAPGQFGRHRESEGNAEGPMALQVAPNGDLLVLDQVNARVQRFRRDGTPLGSLPIGPATAQDVATDASGHLLVLDRTGDHEVLVYGPDGTPLDRIPVVGGAIIEAGGVSGLFVDGDGVYLEREHTESVRIANASSQPLPDRATEPGRPSRDGTLWLWAAMADRAAGTVTVRAFRRDAQLSWQRVVAAGEPILHLSLLDSDRRGFMYVGAFVAREQPEPPYALYDQAIAVVRLTQASGQPAGTLALPAPGEPEESFRELAVGDDGTIYQMLPGPDGIEIRSYRFP